MTISGGLVQLVAYGASDIYLISHDCDCEYQYANHRDSMMHWFVDREDGFPIEEDLRPTSDPFTAAALQHAEHISLPFDTKQEKAATRIQAKFKEAITNPDHPICKRRLMREFEELH